MERVKIAPKESDLLCPNCGKKMLIREGRFGEFLGCAGYPECKTTMPLSKPIDIKCPACGEGDIVEKSLQEAQGLLRLQPLPGVQLGFVGQAGQQAVPQVQRPPGRAPLPGQAQRLSVHQPRVQLLQISRQGRRSR